MPTRTQPMSWPAARSLAIAHPGSSIVRSGSADLFIVVYSEYTLSHSSVTHITHDGTRFNSIQKELAVAIDTLDERDREVDQLRRTILTLELKVAKLEEVNAALESLNTKLNAQGTFADLVTKDELAMLRKANYARVVATKRAERNFEDCTCQGYNQNCARCSGRGYIRVYNGLGESVS